MVGVYPDDFSRSAEFFGALRMDFEKEGERRSPYTRNTHVNLYVLIEQDRFLVLDQCPDGVKVFSCQFYATHVIKWQRLEIFSDRCVEISQIVRVKNDFLAIDLGITDTKRPGEPEIRLAHLSVGFSCADKKR